jgi:hypothetical protein
MPGRFTGAACGVTGNVHEVVRFAAMGGQLKEGIDHQSEPLSPRRRGFEPVGETVT